MNASQIEAASWADHWPGDARTPRLCAATKANGEPCRGNPAPGATFCVHHAPEMKDEMQRRRAKGNASRGRLATTAKAAEVRGAPPPMTSLEDAVHVAAWITDAVLKGTLDARTAEAATKSVRQYQLGAEKADLLRRIKLLEQQLKAAKVAA